MTISIVIAIVTSNPQDMHTRQNGAADPGHVDESQEQCSAVANQKFHLESAIRTSGYFTNSITYLDHPA